MELNKALKIAIDHIEEYGLTDTILQKPKELENLKIPEFRSKIEEEVRNCINEIKTCASPDKDNINVECFSRLKMLRIHHTLLPKKVLYDYRKCAIIESIDQIKYLTIVLMLAEEIEKHRIPVSDNIVYSYRISVNDKRLFDPNYHYGEFNKKYKEEILNPINKVIVKCDIANFYDRLNLHKLEAVLYNLPVEKKLVKVINEILLFWAERNSYGLPVGNNASRILAEASLIDVDKFLVSHNVKFIRFVDDFILFAEDAKTAHFWLSILIERLSKEGLMLNQSKTEIFENNFDTKINDLSKVKNESNKIDKFLENGSEVYVGGEYGGEVPLKFLDISEEKKNEIRNQNEIKLLDTLKSQLIIEPENFIDFCETISVKNKFELAIHLPILLEKFPQFIPYTIDFLIVNANKIKKEDIDKIKNNFENDWIKNHDKLPDYILAPLIRFFANSHFRNKKVLINLYRALPANKGLYIHRMLLDNLYSIIDRNEAKEIQGSYSSRSNWEKRQIISILRKHFEAGELRTYFKVIKAEHNEAFIDGMVSIL